MEFSQVKTLFNTLNKTIKQLKKIQKPAEDVIQKMIIMGKIKKYHIDVVYYFDKKIYNITLHCDDYIPTFGISKSYVEARSYAYESMLILIRNNQNVYLSKEDKRSVNERLNGELSNSKADKYEIEKELCEEADVKLYETEFDSLPDNIKKKQLDEKLEIYHNCIKSDENCNEKKELEKNDNCIEDEVCNEKKELSFDYEKNEDLLTEYEKDVKRERELVDQIKIDYMKNGTLKLPIARPSVPVFGRPMKFKKSV
jgi:hypothetical protein